MATSPNIKVVQEALDQFTATACLLTSALLAVTAAESAPPSDKVKELWAHRRSAASAAGFLPSEQRAALVTAAGMALAELRAFDGASK